MSLKFAVALSGFVVSMSGCAKDYSLAPPPESEHVTVTVKVHDELVAETMEVVYRSTLCASMRYTAIGTSYKRDGVQRLNITPVRIATSDIYEAKLPRDGGGACQWRLSNVTFGVKYEDPTRLGENVSYGGGGGVVVMFDHNNSPHGGADIETDGDLIIKQDYYPWVDEGFLGQYKKTISLASGGYSYRMYKALQAQNIYFEPVLHTQFVLYSKGPKVKEKGNYTSYTYPDGSVYADGRSHPNFLRLQTIRLKAEGKQ
jgi:hypothetical protein